METLFLEWLQLPLSVLDCWKLDQLASVAVVVCCCRPGERCREQVGHGGLGDGFRISFAIDYSTVEQTKQSCHIRLCFSLHLLWKYMHTYIWVHIWECIYESAIYVVFLVDPSIYSFNWHAFLQIFSSFHFLAQTTIYHFFPNKNMQN